MSLDTLSLISCKESARSLRETASALAEVDATLIDQSGRQLRRSHELLRRTERGRPVQNPTRGQSEKSAPRMLFSRNPPPSENMPESDTGHKPVPPQLESPRGSGRTS